MSEPRVKGVAFRTIDACHFELRGAKLHARAQELMLPELRDAYQSGLMLAASWYPISWYRDALKAFRAAGNEGLELPRQIGFQAVKRDMRTIYKRIFAMLVSPQTLLSMSQRIFSQYYDTGKAEVPESRRGHCVMRFDGTIGWDANMYMEIEGSSVSLLEIAGGREVRVRIRSGGKDGDTHCEFEAHWV